MAMKSVLAAIVAAGMAQDGWGTPHIAQNTARPILANKSAKGKLQRRHKRKKRK